MLNCDATLSFPILSRIVVCALCFGPGCIEQAPTSEAVRAHIIEGHPVAIEAAPWQAQVLRNGKFHCGAAILNEWTLLTAAHCVAENDSLPATVGRALEPDPFSVVVGSSTRSDLHGSNDSEPTQQQAGSIMLHPEFQGYSNSSFFQSDTPIRDLAIIKVRDPLDLDGWRAAAIPLADSRSITSPLNTASQLLITGWGLTESGAPAEHLLAVQDAVQLSRSEASSIYCRHIVHSSTLCDHWQMPVGTIVLWHPAPHASSTWLSVSAPGDSGGPLAMHTEQGWQLMGITASGAPPLSLFESVSTDDEWLKWVMESN